MPYIKQNRRIEIAESPEPGNLAENPGELNWVITTIIHNYVLEKGKSYATFNEVIGVLECAKLELYRKIIARYENKKRKENGNISKLDR